MEITVPMDQDTEQKDLADRDWPSKGPYAGVTTEQGHVGYEADEESKEEGAYP